ncbi:glutaredoxin [Streptohalobacillus salinus]|uniref:Glutaredoxin n=1 Tax=Streptohalobacillus salinus TaxID=621096 RepID=A0A2V3WKD9_9BACI|nr:glutaredoxin family protein [Streptohalobacillus salinus]PXW89169.1 glutaredoxin [Streptohalobacillus salinus]
MDGREVIVYVSDNCHECDRVVKLLEDMNVSHHVRNISENKAYLSDLQKQHIYATPAVLLKDKKVLGYQEKRIKSILKHA